MLCSTKLLLSVRNSDPMKLSFKVIRSLRPSQFETLKVEMFRPKSMTLWPSAMTMTIEKKRN